MKNNLSDLVALGLRLYAILRTHSLATLAQGDKFSQFNRKECSFPGVAHSALHNLSLRSDFRLLAHCMHI